RLWMSPLPLRQQLFDHLALAEQGYGPTRGTHQVLVRVEAQGAELCGGDVVRGAGLAGGRLTIGVGGAVDVAAPEAATGGGLRARGWPRWHAGTQVGFIGTD